VNGAGSCGESELSPSEPLLITRVFFEGEEPEIILLALQFFNSTPNLSISSGMFFYRKMFQLEAERLVD
jgi:hypothetical protein